VRANSCAAPHSRSASGSGSVRGAQPGCAARTSSWWMANSALSTTAATGAQLVGSHAGGPCRTRSTTSAYGVPVRRRSSSRTARACAPAPTGVRSST
jgi:hypothetical protein